MSPTRTVLLSARRAGAVTWRRLLEQMPPERRDVYFTPEYAVIWERAGEGVATAFVHGEPPDFILHVFLRRRLRDLPFVPADSRAAKAFDIITPYGYGGPIASSDRAQRPDFVAGFFEAFQECCTKAGIVSEFCRLHPVLRNDELARQCVDVIHRWDTVVVPLDAGDEGLLAQISSHHRRNIRKAHRAGVAFFTPRVESAATEFHRVYLDTMRRRQARRDYHFSREFFADTLRLLGRRAWLLEARVDGCLAAGALAMQWGPHAHYHFGCTAADALSSGAMHALLHELARRAARGGSRLLHIGGGTAPDDGLFRFKAGFSPKRRPFCTYQSIFQPDLYEHLCELRRNAVEAEQHTDDSFFPAYRRPLPE
ncbi:MAG: GNAT family N-acetyltransferase [Armatimonadota bacterium]